MNTFPEIFRRSSVANGGQMTGSFLPWPWNYGLGCSPEKHTVEGAGCRREGPAMEGRTRSNRNAIGYLLDIDANTSNPCTAQYLTTYVGDISKKV